MTTSQYEAVLSRRDEIMRRSVGIDYDLLRRGRLGWDYEGLMATVGYDMDEAARIQLARGVGATPMREAPNLTALARSAAPSGFGARIFIKDEAANASGSFKDRRASLSVYEARERGYEGCDRRHERELRSRRGIAGSPGRPRVHRGPGGP